MKLKRIIVGITACTIVGSTMLTMPISARTTTKVENVGLSDLLNTAKMAVNLKDDLTAEKQAEILDKFDTNGNGQISIGELLAVAQRVARTDESDIVNEYGTADSEETTTAETTIETTETTVETSETTETTVETTETTVETTETTEETTTTTEAVAFNPVIEIDGTEYKDGDTFAAKANKIYEVNATDAENEITVSLTGSKDDEDNDLVRVSENRFEVIKDGTLTITVKSADGQQKTIALNVKIAKSLEDADKAKLCISYQDAGYYSDNYKNFSNEIGRDVFNNKEVEDPEEYWSEIENRKFYVKLTSTTHLYIGAEMKISGFAIVNIIESSNVYEEHYEDYDTTDKITYISTDTNKVTVDENGVITGIASGNAEIIVMVNGKEFSRFTVVVENNKQAEIETSGELYVSDLDCLVEGKYVENASQGKALSLKDLQNQVGAENVKSVSFKNFDGTEIETGISDENGVMYYADTTTSTFYYAITSETGKGSFKISMGKKIIIKVLDMEQYKKYQAEQVKAEAFTVEFYGKKIATATADDTQYYYGDSSKLPYVFIAEGETFSLSDIVKVSGVDDPKITVTNSDNGTSAQNLEYDPLTQTFKTLELTKENSDDNNPELITLSYKASDGTTRTISFQAVVLRPKSVNKIYWTAEQLIRDLEEFQQISNQLILSDEIFTTKPGRLKLTVDNKKMFSVNQANGLLGIYDKLSLVDGYEPKAGDTATITATALNEDNKIYSPNFTVTYTLEIVDALPEISRTLASDTFEYPEDNKSNQDITFENIIEIKNLPDNWKVVPYIKKASDNVGYINANGEKQNVSRMTVDATGIEVVKETNGRYSISGIQVASAYKVPADTSITVGFKVFDADGNEITVNYNNIELSVKGEGESISVTINGETVTDYGLGANEEMTVYVEENNTFKLSDIVNIKSVSGKTIDDIKVTNSDEGKETQNVKYNSSTGELKAIYLTEKNSGNNNIDTLTFSYTTGNNEERKVTVNMVTVMPGLKEKNSDGTYSRVDVFLCTLDDIKNGNLPIPTFLTSVDKNGKYILDEDIPWDEFFISSGDETKLKVNGKTLTATENLEVGDTVEMGYAYKQYYLCRKIHIVEAVPTVSRNPSSKIGTEIKSTDREPVKFEDVFQISDIPDGYTLKFYVTDSNMKYGTQNADSPIDATSIELIKEENGLYSLGNIKCNSYDSLKDGVQYKLTGYVMLCDEDGYIAKEFAPNTFYIQKNDELKVTIGDYTKTATDKKTVNMGTVYLGENRKINMEDIAKLTGYLGGGITVTSSDPSIVSAFSDRIETQAYNSNMADKSATLRFTNRGGNRTVTVNVIVGEQKVMYMVDNSEKISYNGKIVAINQSRKKISGMQPMIYDTYPNYEYIDNSNVGAILDKDGNVQSDMKIGDTQTIKMRDEYGNDYSLILKYYKYAIG